MARRVGDDAQLPLWVESSLNFILRFRRFGRDMGGILLLAAASMTLLALIGLTSGAWLTPWATLLRRWLGWGSILVVIGFGAAGLLIIRLREERFSPKDWGRAIALEFAAVGSLGLLTIMGGNSIERAEIGLDGGVIGWGLVALLEKILSAFPMIISNVIIVLLFLALIFIGLMYGLGLIGQVFFRLEQLLETQPSTGRETLTGQKAISLGEMTAKLKSSSVRKKRTHIPAEHRKQFKIDDQEDDKVVSTINRDDQLPPLDLLGDEASAKPDERQINLTAGLIEKTLAEFGIPAKVIGFQVGPTITQFAVEPGYIQQPGKEGEQGRQKVRVSKISGLQQDLALALSAQRLRIQAPVPGRSYVGIEVPNNKVTMVRLRSVIESEIFHNINSPLAIALGRDVSGQAVATDLARMPHLLIAGTTGSGKSVCITALTICLIMNNSPEDLRLVMIDPKRVELLRFNNLPHLIGNVETDLERINGVLRWVLIEMQRRYKLLEELRARDIQSYNKKISRRKDNEHLPRIVVLIDELADLMMSASEKTETTLVRLAQMARATGIHLVVATQRPSTDVVTGLIKANFPARLSFAVASGTDSRVILDGPGAETLLGRGDMLFMPPEAGVPLRAQGVAISDQEMENVINYWRDNWQSEEIEETEERPPWDDMMAQDA
ncbi:MAG: DNA translocase FtsK, partial [Chloroflexota bacterium]